MTAKTSEELARALDAVGLVDMAKKARQDRYHDFLSDEDMPEMALEAELRWHRDHALDPIQARLIEQVRQRMINGEFDASKEESEEWMQSPEGQDAARKILGDMMGKKDGKA